jgi:hypothetical protein
MNLPFEKKADYWILTVRYLRGYSQTDWTQGVSQEQQALEGHAE